MDIWYKGHVDQTATCTKISEENGSWYFYFEYQKSSNLTIEKGSISINGVSLTIVESMDNGFSVAIIPYTYENTNFKNIQVGDLVNIEFDMIGKYIQKLLKPNQTNNAKKDSSTFCSYNCNNNLWPKSYNS